MATWISIARCAVRSLHHLATTKKNPRNPKVAQVFFDLLGSYSNVLSGLSLHRYR